MSAEAVRVMLRPGMLALHVFAVAVVVFTVLAGAWQWRSYQDRQDADAAALQGADPVPLTAVLGPDDPLTSDADGRNVLLQGRFAGPDQQFLVDQRAGGDVWVVQPFLVGSSAVLVVLGSTSDDEAPAVAVTDTDVTGVVQPSESGTDRLDSDRVIGNLNTAVLVGQLPTDLYSAFVVRTYDEEPVPDGLEPVQPSYPDTSWSAGFRNLMYALQWWLFGAFAVFMWVRICRDQVRG